MAKAFQIYKNGDADVMLAADRNLAPDYPGISEAENLGDWDPPFPIDFRRVRDKDEDALTQRLYDFITERMRVYYLEREDGLTPEMFAAVMARRPDSLLDFDKRLKAVAAFVKLEPASSLASANKRIGNILKQAGVNGGPRVDQSLIKEPAETALFESVVKARKAVTPLLESRDYTNV